MITNQLSRTLTVGFWVVVGTFGCADQGGLTAYGTGGNSPGATGGVASTGTSSSVNTGGGINTNTRAGGFTGNVNAGGTTSVASAGGVSATGGAASTGGSNASGTHNTGGSKATGGVSTNTGGKSGTGGSKATGGKSGTGGSSVTGGSEAKGGSQATGGSSAQSTSSCSISASSSVSSTIGPVGIVTFTVSGASSLDSAEINFGLDTNYGLTAPVDVATSSSNYRTLLLGMKINKTYHFKVTGKSGNTTCTSPDYTITAGGCSTKIAKPALTNNTSDLSKLDGGFLVTESYTAGASTTSSDYAYILDGDGELVWCYQPSGFGDLTATRMSWDGKYMWIAHGNVPSQTAHMGRVTMDGTFEDLSSKFTGLNHDADVLPNDEAVVFIAYGSNGCDDIKEWKPDGSVRTIINSGKPFGNSTACHCNAIKYDQSDDTIVVSELDHNAFFKTDRQGNVKWVLGGGTYNTFDKSGGGVSTWTHEHNMHLLGTDSSGAYRFLFFNNGSTSSLAREFKLDLTAMTTSEVWQYASSTAINNAVMGDVQRLSNGNTLVAYSLSGTVHEVDASKTLLQTLKWSGSIGYVTKRKTLYGPPPR